MKLKNKGNIILVGPMGAGKTTIGKSLADRLAMQFIDSDNEIIRRTGAEIPLIFEIEGEEGFRQREKKMLEELCEKNDLVIATGGGAVIDRENRELLRSSGYVIYLQASPEQLSERTKKDIKRPLLQTADRLGRITELLEKRDPLYIEMADTVVNTEGKSVGQVTNMICKNISDNA